MAYTYKDIMQELNKCASVEKVERREEKSGTLLYIDIIMTDGTVYSISCYNNKNYHLYVKWSEKEPTKNEDIKDEPTGCNWIGFYVGEEAEAPTDYSKYTWNGANDLQIATEEDYNIIFV